MIQLPSRAGALHAARPGVSPRVSRTLSLGAGRSLGLPARRSLVTHGASPKAEAPETEDAPAASPSPSTAPQHHTARSQPPRDASAVRQQRLDRKRQGATYQFAAIAASSLVLSTAIAATYYRIAWHLGQGDAFPWLELASTLALAAGGMVGMEMYARWAHKVLWHDNDIGFLLHKSHHEPRLGAFEANDIYAVMNAVPAIALCLYGFMRPDVIGGCCFGAGLGISLFGMSYMFVHDGLVHRRFPVGPLAEAPWLRRIAVAHQIHHTDKYGGVPYGMFLGPQELEAVGGGEELDRLVAARVSVKTDSQR